MLFRVAGLTAADSVTPQASPGATASLGWSPATLTLKATRRRAEFGALGPRIEGHDASAVLRWDFEIPAPGTSPEPMPVRPPAKQVEGDDPQEGTAGPFA